MDNRGEIVDEKDRWWVLNQKCFGGAYIPLEEWEGTYSSDGYGYSIREALIARKMGLS